VFSFNLSLRSNSLVIEARDTNLVVILVGTPQRGVGLREPNLGKTNPRVTLYLLAICFPPSLADSIIFLTLTRLVVVFIFVNFSFALFTPPLGDYQLVSKPGASLEPNRSK
jgi:hypothetical protein